MPEPNGNDKDPKPASITLDIDGQQVTKTAEDVANLIAQQASATQKTQQVAAVMQAAEKYGLSPEDLVSQADGAFAVMSDLIDKGVIDNKGSILVKPGDPPPDPSIPPVTPPGAPAVPPEDAALSPVVQDMVKKMEIIESALQNIERDQTHMIRLDLQRQVQAKHSNLSDDDVSKLFGIAMNDKTKTVWQHAESLSKRKEGFVADLRKKHAEEFGVDLDEFELANKLREQEAEGGASAIFKGKSFSFKKGDKDTITPRQATMEFFKNIHRKGA